MPLRLGEPLRVLSVVRRARISAEAATASTVTLRAADLLAVVVLGLVSAPAVFVDILGVLTWLAVGATAAAVFIAWRWLARVAARRADVRVPGPGAIGLSVVAWLLEAVLVWQSARWAGLELGWSEALRILDGLPQLAELRLSRRNFTKEDEKDLKGSPHQSKVILSDAPISY